MAKNVRSPRRGGSKKKAKRSLSSGQVHVMASFNNTIITVTDMQGNTVAWGSAGSAGFKGSRKSTPFAARLAAEQAGKAAQQLGIQYAYTVEIITKSILYFSISLLIIPGFMVLTAVLSNSLLI